MVLSITNNMHNSVFFSPVFMRASQVGLFKASTILCLNAVKVLKLHYETGHKRRCRITLLLVNAEQEKANFFPAYF